MMTEEKIIRWIHDKYVEDQSDGSLGVCEKEPSDIATENPTCPEEAAFSKIWNNGQGLAECDEMILSARQL